jgi:hypothetical protein
VGVDVFPDNLSFGCHLEEPAVHLWGGNSPYVCGRPL